MIVALSWKPAQRRPNLFAFVKCKRYDKDTWTLGTLQLSRARSEPQSNSGDTRRGVRGGTRSQVHEWQLTSRHCTSPRAVATGVRQLPACARWYRSYSPDEAIILRLPPAISHL